MAEPLQDWVETHVKKYKDVDVRKMYNQLFFREENRAIHYDPLSFYSPADGVIIYQSVVKPEQKILEIKGKKYTLYDILMKEQGVLPEKNYWVVGVFMTLYDVHINRAPTDGLFKWKHLEPIESYNLPMLFMEKDIFKNDINYSNNYDYLFKNERVINDILYMKKQINYSCVQIADMDVNTITHFSHDQPDNYSQGERFSFIRWGSQCDLIIPEHPRYKFKFAQKEEYHVKAGLDKLITIEEK